MSTFAPGDEVLSGGDAIAKIVGMTRRQLYHHVARGRLPPVYRIGQTLFARRSALVRWLSEQEAKARQSTGAAA